MYLEVQNLCFRYTNATIDTLKNVTFSLPKGSILGVQGDSGSGKSTLLRLLAGLEKPATGTIIVDGQVFCDDKIYIEPEKRDIGMVFQDYALFPHMTVEKNILFGLNDKRHKKEILQEMLDLVNIHDLVKRYPYELSGGQQQRVALARALARKPSILLLDEPFSNLDANLQNKIRNELYETLQKSKTTTVFVSHDIIDVQAISDYVLHCKNGLCVDFYANEPRQNI